MVSKLDLIDTLSSKLIVENDQKLGIAIQLPDLKIISIYSAFFNFGNLLYKSS